MSLPIDFSFFHPYINRAAGQIGAFAEAAKVQARQVYSTVTNKVSSVAESIIPSQREIKLINDGFNLLEGQINKLGEENVLLTNQIKLLQKQATQYEATAKLIRETCSMMNSDLVDSKKLVKQLTQERDDYKQKFEGLGGVFEIQNKEISRLSAENQKLIAQTKQLTKSRDCVRALHTNVEHALDVTRKHCHELEDSRADAERDRNRLQELFDKSQRELESLKGPAEKHPEDLSLVLEQEWEFGGK